MQTKPLLGALAVVALAGSAALLGPSAAASQPRSRSFGPPPFAHADANGDGVVTGAEWTALFNSLDADHDGKLESSELPGRPPHGPEALAFIVAHGGDANGDGKVTLDEFKARIAKLDKDGDGALSLSELPLRGPGAFGDRTPPFFDDADGDQDGKLEVSELVAAFDLAASEHDGALPVHAERSPRGRR